MSHPDELEFEELRAKVREAMAHISALELAQYRQQQQLDLLQGQLKSVYQQLHGQAGGEGAAIATDPRDDLPPHY